MDWLSWGIVIALIAFIIYTKRKPKENEQSTTEITPTQVEHNDFSKCYQKKYLLTKNEYYEWKKLSQFAEKHKLIICPKVRLLDIIEPRKGEGNYMSLLGKVQSKHVDFLICDSSLRIIGVIELDDSSHNQSSRKDRDSFVDQILESVGYTIVHTHGITESTLDSFIRNTTTKQTDE